MFHAIFANQTSCIDLILLCILDSSLRFTIMHVARRLIESRSYSVRILLEFVHLYMHCTAVKTLAVTAFGVCTKVDDHIIEDRADFKTIGPVYRDSDLMIKSTYVLVYSSYY